MYSQILQTFKTIDIDRIRPLGFLKRETEWAKIACEKVVNGSGFIDIHTCPICKNNKYSRSTSDVNCVGIHAIIFS